VIFPTFANETLGREDPKVYEADGRYVLFYNAIWRTETGAIACDIMCGVSDDLETWEKRGLVVPHRRVAAVGEGRCGAPGRRRPRRPHRW